MHERSPGATTPPTYPDTYIPPHVPPHTIQTGGVKPATTCASPSDTGNKNFVPYTADYLFYRHVESDC
jgi:hypothetical protein